MAGLTYLSLFACSRPIQTDQVDPQNIPNDRVAVIDATPLPNLPNKLEAQSSGLSPWIQPKFLGQLQNGNSRDQGLWVQSSHQVLAAHQARTPLSAASLTKVATSLAALQRLGPTFRFVTQFGTVGTITNGTLQGDLVVMGGDDPLFVWEDAFAVANELSSLGIREIKGDLIIKSPFVMNFEENSQLSATLLRESLSFQSWPPEAIAQFNTLPPGTQKPNLTLQGAIRVVDAVPADTTWRVMHSSRPLVELLKQMNRYSNNPMADQIAQTLGGASEVTKSVRSLTNLDAQDLNFINGSGLGPENQITPQGATLMFQALSNLLQSNQMSLGDVLTIVGKDEGILDPRPLPQGLVVKSGTLDQVSALAGVLPTQDQGLVWFTMLNTQGDVVSFRQTQEALLQKMARTWGTAEGEKLLTPTLNPTQLQALTQRLEIATP